MLPSPPTLLYKVCWLVGTLKPTTVTAQCSHWHLTEFDAIKCAKKLMKNWRRKRGPGKVVFATKPREQA